MEGFEALFWPQFWATVAGAVVGVVLSAVVGVLMFRAEREAAANDRARERNAREKEQRAEVVNRRKEREAERAAEVAQRAVERAEERAVAREDRVQDAHDARLHTSVAEVIEALRSLPVETHWDTDWSQKVKRQQLARDVFEVSVVKLGVLLSMEEARKMREWSRLAMKTWLGEMDARPAVVRALILHLTLWHRGAWTTSDLIDSATTIMADLRE